METATLSLLAESALWPYHAVVGEMRKRSVATYERRSDLFTRTCVGLFEVVHLARMGKGNGKFHLAAFVLYSWRALPKRFNALRVQTAKTETGKHVCLLELANANADQSEGFEL